MKNNLNDENFIGNKINEFMKVETGGGSVKKHISKPKYELIRPSPSNPNAGTFQKIVAACRTRIMNQTPKNLNGGLRNLHAYDPEEGETGLRAGEWLGWASYLMGGKWNHLFQKVWVRY